MCTAHAVLPNASLMSAAFSKILKKKLLLQIYGIKMLMFQYWICQVLA